MRRQSINNGQRLSPSARKIIRLRQRAFSSGGASLELQIPTNYIREISRNLNNDITRDVARKNIFDYSEDFTNAFWTKSETTATANTIANPLNGAIDADTFSQNGLLSTFTRRVSRTVALSGQYTLSVYAKKKDFDGIIVNVFTSTSNNIAVNLNDGSTISTSGVATYSVTSAGSGWWRIAVSVNLSNITRLDFVLCDAAGNVVFNDTNTFGTYIWGAQFEASSAATAYQPTQAFNIDTGASLIMTPNTIGESRIFNCKPNIYNLLQRTEEFDNAYWSKTRSAIVVNSIANPIDGLVTADKLREDATANATHYMQRITPLEVGNTYTLSAWVKAGERNFVILSIAGGTPVWGTGNNPMINFDTNTGTVGFTQNATSTIQNYGNGWYRISMTPTLNLIDGAGAAAQIVLAISGTVPVSNYSGDGASGLYVWGAQLEKGSVPTGYQRISDGIIDFQATRATTATVVQKDGTIGNGCYNLSPYSEDYTNAAWTKTLTTITANTDINPISKNNTVCKVLANTTSNSSVRIFNTLAPNTTGVLTLTGYVKAFLNVPFIHVAVLTAVGTAATTLGACIDTSNGNITQGRLNGSPATILPNTSSSTIVNGYIYFRMTWNNPTNLVFVNLSIYLATDATSTSFTGNVGDGVYLTNLQLTQGSTPKDYLKTTNRLNVPSIDYGLGSNLPALLVEPLRTNLVLRSEEFDNASWFKNNLSVTANATSSPNNTITADKFVENSTNNFHFLQQPVNIVSGNNYTFSVFVKAAERDVIQLSIGSGFAVQPILAFNITLQTFPTVSGLLSFSSVNIGNGWYRLIMTTLAANATVGANAQIFISNSSYLGNGTSGIYVWGAQVEAGSNATSYIFTSSVTVNRNLHTSYVDLFNNSLLNKDNFTLYVEGQLLGSATTNISIGLSDTTATGARANDLGIIDGITPSYAVGGVITSDVTSSNVNAPFKLTIKRDGTSVKWFRNGALVYTQTIATFDYRYLILNGVSTFLVQKIALWKHSKTDAECIALHSAPYSAEMQAVLAVATSNALTLPNSFKLQALDVFIQTLKAKGIWQKLDCMHNYAFNDTTSASFTRIDLVKPSTTLSDNGTGTTYTTSGFLGNGTTAAVTIFASNSNYTAGNAHAGVVVYQSPTTVDKTVFSAGTTTVIKNENSTSQRLNRNADLSAAVNMTGIGLLAIDRDVLAGYVTNKVIDTTFTYTSTAFVASNNFTLFSQSSTFTDAGVSLFYTGGHLIPSEVQILRAAYNTYLNTIGLTQFA